MTMPIDPVPSTLSTKLHIPPLRADALRRSRLIQRLEDGVHEGRTLTLISAPAGFGKTTLITAWLQQSQRQAAWLSLDDGDNDPSAWLWLKRGHIEAVERWAHSHLPNQGTGPPRRALDELVRRDVDYVRASRGGFYRYGADEFSR